MVSQYTDSLNSQMGSGGLDAGQALRQLQEMLGGGGGAFAGGNGGMGGGGMQQQAGPSGGSWQDFGNSSFYLDPSGKNVATNYQGRNNANAFAPTWAPFDPSAYAVQSGQNMYRANDIGGQAMPGFNADASGLFQMLNGFMPGMGGQNLGPMGNPGYGIQQTGANRAMIETPGSYPISGGMQGAGGFTGGMGSAWGGGGGGASQWGGQPTAPAPSGPSFNPGDDALAFIQSLGGQIPGFMSNLAGGQAISAPGNQSAALRGLGGFQGGVPSPQSFSNMAPSEMEFFKGFLDFLGMNPDDVFGASMAPFQGLQTARRTRRVRK